MEIRPLLSAMWRNRVGPLLVALQIAITLIVLVNASYAIATRFMAANEPTGLDLDNVFSVISEGYAAGYNHAATVTADLAYLNSLPGVIAASTTAPLPQSGGGMVFGFSLDPEIKPNETNKRSSAWVFRGTEKFIDAVGLHLIAGQTFDAASVVPPPGGREAPFNMRLGSEIVITQALASKWFPQTSAVGQTIYIQPMKQPVKIVGVVANMQATPRLGRSPMMSGGELGSDHVVLAPVIAAGPNAMYLVRTAPGRQSEVMARVEREFEQSQPGRLVSRIQTLAKTAAATRFPTRATATILLIVTALVVVVTAVGVFGLAAYNVASRTKQIGTRRAIGARKYHIVRYFLVENWLIATAGMLIGCPVAIWVGVKLSVMFQTPRLPLAYLAFGAVGLWIVGLLSVWLPARRAAGISPAIATRTV